MQKTLTELKCDICSAPMYMERVADIFGQGIHLKCSSCNQTHTFYSNGRHTCNILAKMFPSGAIRDYSNKLKVEFINHWESEQTFFNKARYLGNLINETDYKRNEKRISELVDDFRQKEISLKKKWWQII